MIAKSPVDLDATDRAIINALQDSFPLVSDAFDVVGRTLGMNGEDVLAQVESLLDQGVLTRFGPMFDAAAMGGGFSLCALSVPDADFERVADIVNGFDEVAHNYARDHELNMWFVIGTENISEIGRVIDDIEQATGLFVFYYTIA